MVWFRVDDSFYDHPKVVSIPRAEGLRAAAVGTWTLAGDWCARHLTDGVIPIAQVEELGGTMAGALALVKAKLWTKTKNEFRFKSWAEYQPTRSQVESARESERTRKARQRSKPQESEQSPGPVPPGHPPDNMRTSGGTDTGVPPVSHQVSGHPVPSRPDPSQDSYVSQSSHVPERESYPQDDGGDRSRRAGYWHGWRIANPTRLVELIGRAVERPVSEDQAIVIISGLLAKASPKNPVRSVQAYVEGAVRESWAEIQQELDEAAVAA